MSVTHIVVEGRIPSKKNSRNVFVRGGKQFNIPSKKFIEWHKEAAMSIKAQKTPVWLENVEEIQIQFLMPDNRACDLTNKAESILDLLVDCEVIEDDKWQIIPRILLHAAGIDREQPRADIWIKSNSR
jgi:Holliday junction resolvase RusA-like endonuclease